MSVLPAIEEVAIAILGRPSPRGGYFGFLRVSAGVRNGWSRSAVATNERQAWSVGEHLADTPLTAHEG